jgi:nucleoside-diphosphate-sugar epimerase
MSIVNVGTGDFERPRKLLVIGGAGYIGSTVCFYALTRTNMKVKVLDRLMYGGSALFRFFTFQDRFEFEFGDIRDKDLDALVKGYDYVFYPAALVGEHICKKFPKDAREINQVRFFPFFLENMTEFSTNIMIFVVM